MKGIVFTEFLDMVDDVFGVQITEAIVETSDLPSGGIYTATGTYDHREMLRLVAALSKKSHIPAGELCQRVTGSRLDPQPYVEYLTRKFSGIYGL